MFAKSLLKHKVLARHCKSLFFNKDVAKKFAKSLLKHKVLARHCKSLFFNKDLAKGHQNRILCISKLYQCVYTYFAIWSSCVA